MPKLYNQNNSNKLDCPNNNKIYCIAGRNCTGYIKDLVNRDLCKFHKIK